VTIFSTYVFCNLRIKLETWSYVTWFLIGIAATVHTIVVTISYAEAKKNNYAQWWVYAIDFYVQLVFFVFYLGNVRMIITLLAATNMQENRAPKEVTSRTS